MRNRRVIGMLTGALCLLVLAACGNDADDTSTPTPTNVATQVPTATIAPATMRATAVSAQIMTPVSIVDVAATPMTQPPLATPAEIVTPATVAAPALIDLTGTITLAGQPQQDYVMTAEGCAGLGEWQGVQDGAQIVVRDAAGTVVSLTTLDAATGEECSWSFAAQVPADGYVSIGLPLVFERWFTPAEVGSGAIEIALP